MRLQVEGRATQSLISSVVAQQWLVYPRYLLPLFPFGPSSKELWAAALESWTRGGSVVEDRGLWITKNRKLRTELKQLYAVRYCVHYKVHEKFWTKWNGPYEEFSRALGSSSRTHLAQSHLPLHCAGTKGAVRARYLRLTDRIASFISLESSSSFIFAAAEH